MVEELLRLRTLKTKSPPVNFVNLQRRIKIADRLLEMEISDSQHLFAANALVEAVIRLDAINLTANINAEGVREDLIKVREKYYKHENTALAAKAALGFPLAPLHDYLVSNDKSELEIVADQFDMHGDEILRHPQASSRFVELIVGIYKGSNHLEEHRQLASRVLERLKKSEDPEVKHIAMLLREQIFFSESEIQSLVERIEGGNVVARENVQNLFEGLEANPNSRLEIYEIAGKVIAEYVRLGQIDDADALAKWLNTINQKNESKENREAVSGALTKYKKMRDDLLKQEGIFNQAADTGPAVSPAR